MLDVSVLSLVIVKLPLLLVTLQYPNGSLNGATLTNVSLVIKLSVTVLVFVPLLNVLEPFLYSALLSTSKLKSLT